MDIKELIPQREPFLFIDRIASIEESKIIVEKTFDADLDFFKGHFPENPIVPGVILTEHCFQSGAALVSSKGNSDMKGKLAVVTRIQSAKFKNLVKPGDQITTETTILEMMATTGFFRSVSKNQNGDKVLLLDFACTLVEQK